MKPPLVVVMGVSGVGKTSVGREVAEHAGLDFADGDDLHPVANIEKMAAGTPLTDEDRRPWLATVGNWLASHDESGGVVACSALRRAYRDLLTAHAPRVTFLHLVGDPDLIRSRMRHRDHFMPSSLLASQQATLEPLEPDERGLVLAVADPPDRLAAVFLAAVGRFATS